MRRGTTPTLTLVLPMQILVTDIDEAILSISQNEKNVLEYDLSDMKISETENALCVVLSQQETLTLTEKSCADIQLKVKLGDSVIASDIVRISVSNILSEEVI